MANTFRTLFQVRFTHDFYATGTIPDMEVRPTEPALRVLAGHRALLRREPGGFSVHYSATEQGVPQIPFEAPVSLQFGLEMPNPSFPIFTELPPKAGSAIHLFSNRESPSDLRSGEVTVTRGLLPSLAVPGGGATAELQLRTPEGTVIFTESVPVKDGVASSTFDLRGFAGGLYRFSAQGGEARWIYVRRGMGGPWFALLDLYFAPEALAGAAPAPTLTLKFTARAVQWVYRLVLSQTAASTRYRIAQMDPAAGPPAGDGGGTSDSGGRGRRRARDATPSSPPTPGPGASSAELYFSDPISVAAEGGKQVLEFRTVPRPGHADDTGRIPYRQEPRRNIALLSEDGNSHGASRHLEPVKGFEDLPNPSPNLADPTVTLHI